MDNRSSVYILPDARVWVPEEQGPTAKATAAAKPTPKPTGSPTRKPADQTASRHRRPFLPEIDQADHHDDGPDEPLTVDPELVALAERAMHHWDMKVYGMTVAATKPEKGGAIWWIDTSHGPRSFKLLHRPVERSLFSVGAQDYLVQRQARVPALVRTKQDELFTVVDGRMFITTDWIEGLKQASKVRLEGAAALCYGLGEFHRLSQGYQPPPGAYFATRLAKWPRTYAKMRTKLGWFEAIARAYSDLPASAGLLSVIDQFRMQCETAIALLENSPYRQLVARGEAAWGLVHQDYGWSNGQRGPDGQIWIIDLDGVAFDLPIRDLRKLITSTMDDRGDWDLTWIEGMIKAYHEANPIEPDLMQVMLIDMLLPNEFYKLVKDIVFDPVVEMTTELEQLLERLVVTDQCKQRALQQLGLGRK